MLIEKYRKTVGFTEGDEEFIKQIAIDIGCHYHKSNQTTYDLSTVQTEIPGKTGVFAWVHKEEKANFWIATRTTWLEEARLKSAGAFCPRGTKDGDCVYFDTKADYRNTVNVLKIISQLRQPAGGKPA
jgi:hypothetical protein